MSPGQLRRAWKRASKQTAARNARLARERAQASHVRVIPTTPAKNEPKEGQR
jgi:hypothetical protein